MECFLHDLSYNVQLDIEGSMSSACENFYFNNTHMYVQQLLP